MIALFLMSAVAVEHCSNQRWHLDVQRCLERRVDEAEAELKKQWGATLATIRKEDRRRRGDNLPAEEPALVQSQKAWRAYRDAECHMISGQMRTGASEGDIWFSCMLDLTQKRIAVLKARADDSAFPPEF